MKVKIRRNKKYLGFTLVELIVVIGVLGILVGATFLTLNPVSQLKKGSDAKRKTDLEQVQRALELYYDDHQQYPKNSANYEIISTVAGTDTTITWGTSWTPYMAVLPEDPKSNKKYVYVSDSTNGYQTYYLYSSLDNASDTQACAAGAVCPKLGTLGVNGTTACGTDGVCNYGVSSPNTSP